MSHSAHPVTLDVLRFPLTGSRLIEASAGTGKTFTIAALYVRLVLGHGNQQAFSRPLMPPEILVVTFTDAATQELRDRIRSRLAEASRCFQPPVDTDAATSCKPDPFLLALRAEYPDEQWPACARKLQLAAEWMDEAAVSTIHSWCNRMLSEHAFDSDSLFSQTLETDQSELLQEVVRDYWRIFFFPLTEGEVQILRGWWLSPDELYRSVVSLLDYVTQISSDIPPAVVFAETQAEKKRLLQELKAPWPVWCDELQALLEGAIAAKVVNGRKIQARYFNPWLDKIRHWAASDESELRLDKGWERLTPAGLLDGWKTGEVPPQHPALNAMATLQESLKMLPEARGGILRHACGWVACRFRQEQERRAQMGFNDLLTRLHVALRGENGPHLAEIIRSQFPLAMIDEFQDTDPLQYQIFDTIYQVALNDPCRGLILIGDPKQAIYAFRGADIYTYLRARRDTEGRHYTLGTNYRSTAAIVEAVNHLFFQAEKRPAGAGAFLFRDNQGRNPVPFLTVNAQGRDEIWQDGASGAASVALTLLCSPAEQGLSASDYRQTMAVVCAREIVQLLQRGQNRQAGFVIAGELLHPVQPGDIAVLVNTGREASAIRQALAVRGVRSVYLSDRESVFTSRQAEEIAGWLAACADPDNERLLRAALATASLGMSWQALDRLNHDELEWEARVQQFRDYQHCWRRQGILPMLRRLMWDFDVPRRLLSGEDARALTDLLHLSELLQQASMQLDGEHALLRYLDEQRQHATQQTEVLRLRLESDAAQVKVITVHKSKGLEYPLVFVPFACSFRAVTPTDLPLKWHDDDGQQHIELSASEASIARADHERLGEDLRKFYVALTRARHAIWLGVAPLKGMEKSALGYLLNGGAVIEPMALAGALTALGNAHCCVNMATDVELAPYRQQLTESTLGDNPPLPDRRYRRWRITSYSGLAIAPQGRYIGNGEGLFPLHGELQSAAQAIFSESQERVTALVSRHPGDDMYSFPRGAVPGNFLHGLLEWAGREGFAGLAQDRNRVADQVARRCQRRGWEHWIPILTDWLMALFQQPVPLVTHDGNTAQMILSGLSAGQYQVEMEFWFSLSQVQTVYLDRLVTATLLPGSPRAVLLPDELNGMLKGFIDLVFEHQGRYYILDYKSNWLGAEASDYQQAQMEQAMLQHRYDLQLVLYLFALHRLLKSRLPDYDYERHMGGALYLFLRGSEASGGGVFSLCPDKRLIEQLELLFIGDQQGEL